MTEPLAFLNGCFLSQSQASPSATPASFSGDRHRFLSPLNIGFIAGRHRAILRMRVADLPLWHRLRDRNVPATRGTKRQVIFEYAIWRWYDAKAATTLTAHHRGRHRPSASTFQLPFANRHDQQARSATPHRACRRHSRNKRAVCTGLAERNTQAAACSSGSK